MKKLKILISLITHANDYQQEQARNAEETAARIGAELRVVYADGDAIIQSQQLLEAVQAKSNRPDAIIFEPPGTGLAQVAKAAAHAGIGWVVLNREVDYLPELRAINRAPMFALSCDYFEAGRIQGRQIKSLLPEGGTILHIQGPASSTSASQRTQGIGETIPASISVRTLKGQWTEKSGYDAVSSWLRLSTSRETIITAVVAQNDEMAMGARRAFRELTTGIDQSRWMGLPYLGCDGLPKTGQASVDKGILRATVHIPPNTGQAIQMLVQAFNSGKHPPEKTFTLPESYPSLETLARNSRQFAGTHT